MAEEMSIEAILSAVDQNFTKTMEQAVDSLSKVVGESNKSTSKFAANGAVFGASAAVTAGALGLIKNSLDEVINGLNESSATWKTFEGNMSYIGKSQSQIGKVRSELTKYAQQTIYSASDMATTYSQLAAVGIKNTTKLVKGFGGLASAAEDPKQAMKTLSQQATQMASKPTVQWQDFKLMLEQTPAGIAAVAKSMGLSTSQLVSDVQNGKVKTEDFFNAISKVGTNKAFTKMSTEYKTLGQAMDGLIETITTKLQPAFDALSGIGIKAISGIVNAIDNGGPAIKIITGLGIALMTFVGVLTAVGIALKLAAFAEMAFNAAMSLNPAVLVIAGITALVAALAYFFTQTEVGKKVWKSFCDTAINAWNSFYQIVSSKNAALIGAWNSFTQSMQATYQAIQGFVGKLGGVGQAIQDFVGKLGGVGHIASMIVSTLAKVGLAALGLSGPWGVAAGAVISFVTAWLQTGQLNADGITQVFDQLSNTITNVTNAIVANIPLIVGMITNVIVGIANSISENLPQIIAVGTQIITSLTTAITAALPLLIVAGVQILIALINTIVASLPMIITAGLQIIMALANAIITVLPMLITAGMQIIMALANAIISNLPQIIEAGVEILTALINGIAQVLPLLVVSALQIIVALAGAIISNLPQIIAAGVQIIVALIKGILQMIGNLGSAMAQVGRKIINSVAHIDLSANGKAIMNSLLSGLKRAWESVKSFVGGIGKWIKAHKGPISVDRRLLIPAGHAIMNGLGNGLVDGFSDVQKSVLAMNKQITDAMQPDVSGFANRLNGMASDVRSRFAGSLTMQDSTLQMQNNALLRQIAGKDTTMILDSGALVGATAGSYDQRLGQNVALSGRWS